MLEYYMLKTLFPDSLPTVTTQVELDKVLKTFPEPKFDSYYVCSGAISERRAFFEDLWKDFQGLEDKHFGTEVITQFHNRSWEIYIGAILKRRGHLVEKLGTDVPDFRIDEEIHVECVTCAEGKEAFSTNNKTIGNATIRDVPHKEIELRVTNALSNKIRQHQKWVTGHKILDTSPFVIAINTHLGFPEGIVPYTVSVLEGIGDPFVNISVFGTHSHQSELYLSSEEKLQKSNGSFVQKRLFNTDDFKAVSGVIFTNTNVLNLDPKGEMLQYIRNPNAKVPLPDNKINISQYDRKLKIKTLL